VNANGTRWIVMGASAGGIEALKAVVGGLPIDLDAAVFVVLHLPSDSTSMLPHILSKAGVLKAHHPQDKERILPGRIYVAPPDHHLLLERDWVRVVTGPRENNQRPAIDPLFRSASIHAGSRVIGVVLSGSLDDGVAGLMEIKRRGGIAVIQEPTDALVPSMPRAALDWVPDPDHCVPASAMGALLTTLVRVPAAVAAAQERSAHTADRAVEEVDVANLETLAIGSEPPGEPSGLTCPECHGALHELSDGGLVRYRCRVGHAYAADNMVVAQSTAVERALWVALRALDEKIALSRRIAAHARRRGHRRVAVTFERRAQEAERDAELVRTLLFRESTAAKGADADEGPDVASL
jgi:two-component system, chemotaxis family, protein-glutamate methylesterase/glutaminase